MADGKRQMPRQSQLFFLGIVVLLFFLTWIIFRPFLIFMVAGIFVAVLSLPIDKFWEGRKIPNRLAAFFTMFTIFIIMTGPLVLLGFGLVDDVQLVVEKVQDGTVDRALYDGAYTLAGILNPDANATELNTTVDEWSDTSKDKLVQVGTGFLQSMTGFVINLSLAIVIILFVTYYVLTDGDRLVKYIRRAAPLPPAQVDFLLKEAKNGLWAVFYGQILTSLIQGALGGFILLIAGVPGALVWAVLMAILSLLPVIGAFLIWVPWGIIYLVQGNIFWGIAILAWGAIVVSQVDNFVRPKLIGDRADIHPIFVLVGVLGGVAAWGFIGLFLGPLLVAVTVSILKVWEHDYLDPNLMFVDSRMDDEEEDEPAADAA